MPLPLTNLDDRRWADLVDQGVALIPRYAPSWTDQNIHDPGRTLIELFAGLTEMTVYRLNQVPARHRRKFLKFLGFVAEPPRTAQIALNFTLDANTKSFTLPAGTQFESSTPVSPKVKFATRRDVTLSPVNLAAVQVDSGDGTIRDHSADWRDKLGVAVFGNNPSPGAAVYFGFRDLPVQTPIALWLYCKGPGNDEPERRRIIEEAEEQRIACRKVLPDIQCGPPDAAAKEPEILLPPHHSARVRWEAFTGPADSDWAPLEGIGMPSRPGVGQVMDDTRSLTLDGLVELSVPASVAARQDKLFYIRCRLLQGGYDAPPVLLDVRPNSVLARQSVRVWQTFPIAAGSQVQVPLPSPGQFTLLSISLDNQNRIQKLQFGPAGTPGGPDIAVLKFKSPTNSMPGEITLEMVVLGSGTGRPLAPSSLPDFPVWVKSMRLYTHSGTAWQEWSRQADLDSSQRTDFHFVLDATTGEVVFGDGERGRTPAPQELIVATYQSTQAELGNIAADKGITLTASLHNAPILAQFKPVQQAQLSHVQQQLVEGGAAEESLVHLTGRAFERLHAHERLLDLATEQKSSTLDQLDRSSVQAIVAPGNAVNLLDIERLAFDVPGTRVARAQACASSHPDYPCLHAPGFVRVVILPAMPAPEPKPTAGLLQAVKRFLDRRRTVCTRVEVIGPQYVQVQVTATVKLESGASATRVIGAIDQALKVFLDPFVGGPKGRGWPFGRSVYRTEVMQLIAAVHGVGYVIALSMSSGSGDALCGDLPLCPSFLTSSGKHNIQVQK